MYIIGNKVMYRIFSENSDKLKKLRYLVKLNNVCQIMRVCYFKELGINFN